MEDTNFVASPSSPPSPPQRNPARDAAAAAAAAYKRRRAEHKPLASARLAAATGLTRVRDEAGKAYHVDVWGGASVREAVLGRLADVADKKKEEEEQERRGGEVEGEVNEEEHGEENVSAEEVKTPSRFGEPRPLPKTPATTSTASSGTPLPGRTTPAVRAASGSRVASLASKFEMMGLEEKKYGPKK